MPNNELLRVPLPCRAAPTRRLAPLVAAFALLAGCQDSTAPAAPPPECSAAAARALSAADRAPARLAVELPPLDDAFRRAERDFGVPAALLQAVGYVETRWQMLESRPAYPGQPSLHGLMGIKGAALARAAALAGLSEAEVRRRPEANVRAAAALLRAYADEAGLDRADLGAWAPALARYSGITTAAARRAYVEDDVYGILRRGAVGVARGGTAALTLAARAERLGPPSRPARALADACPPPPPPTDFAGALWRPAPSGNFRLGRPAGEAGKVVMVIIHTCESGYSSCWGWLTNPQAGVSAHYVVNESGSEVSQLVREANEAWHIAARYDCTLNGHAECQRNGQRSNEFTVGIEHAGFAAQTAWPATQIDASARLVCDMSKRWGIPRDRFHVVAHGTLQPHNRTDPGANWPWAQYLARIDAHCGA